MGLLTGSGLGSEERRSGNQCGCPPGTLCSTIPSKCTNVIYTNVQICIYLFSNIFTRVFFLPRCTGKITEKHVGARSLHQILFLFYQPVSYCCWVSFLLLRFNSQHNLSNVYISRAQYPFVKIHNPHALSLDKSSSLSLFFLIPHQLCIFQPNKSTNNKLRRKGNLLDL